MSVRASRRDFVAGYTIPQSRLDWLWKPVISHTACEDRSAAEWTRDRQAVAAQKAAVQAEINRLQGCPTCLYTGVATCLGLSAYFVHLAYETVYTHRDWQRQLRQRPIFLALSGLWLVAGGYRWQLG